MKIIEALLNEIDSGLDVKTIAVGAFVTAVVADKCGLASTQPSRDHPHGSFAVDGAGELLGNKTGELARLALSKKTVEAGIGMAAINAALPVDESRVLEIHGMEFIKSKVEGKSLTVIGHFPFVSKLTKFTRECHVIEKRPKAGDLPEDAAEECLRSSDAAIITGAAITNHTIEDLLKYAQNAYVMVLGPSSPLSPVMFDFGVDAVAGTIVEDVETVINGVAQGAVYRQLKGVRRVVMERVTK